MREINEADHFIRGAKPRSGLVREFRKLIDDCELPEARYQEFLEEHPDFLMQPFLLNHQLHFDSIVSQFRLNTDITADFCYLTKSSASWWLVLIEIEPPHVPLFLSKKTRLIQTAEFTERLAQIQEWKDEVSKRRDEIIAQLSAIHRPLADNPVHFKYVLIVGRDPIGRDREAWRRIDQLNGTDTRIITFDSLLRNYRARRGRTCNIIALTKGKVRFKNLNVLPRDMLRFARSADLIFTADQKRRLKRWGVSLKGLEQGHPFPFKIQMRKVSAAMQKAQKKTK